MTKLKASSCVALAAACVAIWAPGMVGAQELLTNGNLNASTPQSVPSGVTGYIDIPTGWELITDPSSAYPDPIVRYPGFQAGYAEHANPGGAGAQGVVFNSTEGDFPGFPDVIFVDAHLSQTVPATAGRTYKMTGWAYFEGGYAGGVDFIDANSGTTRAGLPSLTDTFFALEFLDASNAVLGGSVEIELRAAGQVNNPDQTEATRNWMQHTLMGVAPAGTASVRVRASMVDGEFNVDLPHQAAWVDDFSLTVVPEPASAALGLLGLLALGSRNRRARIS